MDVAHLQRSFVKIGARVKFVPMRAREYGMPIIVDVRQDRKDEFFELRVRDDAKVLAVDTRADMRHLLLHAPRGPGESALKLLCGHDERHWFVAGIPGDRGVSDVITAMEALKPAMVRDAQDRARLDRHERVSRHDGAFKRQGEWFFVPQHVTVDPLSVRRNELLRRSWQSKPHIAEFAYRAGGESVMVSHRFPAGLLIDEYRQRLAERPSLAKDRWWHSRRNPQLFVRGTIRHADHATITLDGWHRVLMNEEGRAPTGSAIAFLD